MEHLHDSKSHGTMNSKANIAMLVILAITGVVLLTEHWTHVTAWFPGWPYLLLLACPLMHLFMHGGHDDHEHRANRTPDDHAKKD